MIKILLLMCCSFSVFAGLLTGKVIKVIDGDTLDVLQADKSIERIRLAAIDAPEKGQAFGKKAKQYLLKAVAGKDVSVDYHKRGKYKRIIGRVRLNGQDINLQMIVSGHAWHYKKFQNEQARGDRLAYAEAFEQARQFNIGLFADKAAVAPWDYRRIKRAPKKRQTPLTREGLSVVWVNTRSKKYHCSTSKYFGRTVQGEYEWQATAIEKDYQPAHGKACESL